MTTTMALLSSSPTPTFSSKPHTFHHLHSLLCNKPTKTHLSLRASSSDNGAGGLTVEATPPTVTSTEDAAAVVSTPPPKMERSEDSVGPVEEVGALAGANKFKDAKWINGTWDLKQFVVNGVTNWDAVIDAEAKRRKWLETYPESTTNNEPVIFDTSIIPWWAWIKRFHLPEAELLNGRAAMIGFFMSYFVDSLTGVGLVDQMSNFFCKTLLFVAVLGVLFIRKNEDVEKLKKLLDETTFYDKQWQATWQEDIKKD